MQKLVILGDIALNDLFLQDKKNNQKRFNQITKLMDNSSFTIANLEVPIKGNDDDKNPNKNLHIYTEHDIVKEIFPLINIKVVSLANNHICDYGVSGIQNTIDTLDELNILHTGAGTKEEHLAPVIFSVDRKKVAFLAYVDKSTNPKCENISNIFINYFDEQKVIEDIELIREKVNKIILSIHWGNDYSYFYTKKQQNIAHNLIESGVDIIAGHHPHTIQSYEIFKEKPIFYSLGQLCFGDFFWEGELRALKRKTKVGMIVKIDLKNIKNFSIILTKEHKGNYISSLNCNVKRKFYLLSYMSNLKNNYSFLNCAFKIKESFIDRIYEYFFGYYRNPLKQSFSLKNFRKIKLLIRDYKKYE